MQTRDVIDTPVVVVIVLVVAVIAAWGGYTYSRGDSTTADTDPVFGLRAKCDRFIRQAAYDEEQLRTQVADPANRSLPKDGDVDPFTYTGRYRATKRDLENATLRSMTGTLICGVPVAEQTSNAAFLGTRYPPTPSP